MVWFRLEDCIEGFLIKEGCPCWEETNKYKEYTAARKAIQPKGIVSHIDKNKALEISIISPSKLIEGGAAMLAAERQNHHKVIEGKRESMPLFKKILRDLEDS